jgi:hypothetical protein
MVLEVGNTNCTFKRLTTPPDFLGVPDSGTSPTSNSYYGIGVPEYRDLIYGEYLIDGQPTSHHSYGNLVLIPPANGGATCGTLLTVLRQTLGFKALADTAAAHKLDLPSTSVATGSLSWSRVTSNQGGQVHPPPGWSVFVPVQNRVYYEAQTLRAPRWFDRGNNAYVNGTGTARAISAFPNTGTMFHVPERDLLVYIDHNATSGSGAIRVQYCRVGASDTDPSWAVATLSGSVQLTLGWSCADWVPPVGKIIGANIDGNDTSTFEVVIPAVLTDPWTLTTRALAGGSLPIPLPANPVEHPGSGMYTKWRYMHSVRGFLLVLFARDSGEDDIYYFRPHGV